MKIKKMKGNIGEFRVTIRSFLKPSHLRYPIESVSKPISWFMIMTMMSHFHRLPSSLTSMIMTGRMHHHYQHRTFRRNCMLSLARMSWISAISSAQSELSSSLITSVSALAHVSTRDDINRFSIMKSSSLPFVAMVSTTPSMATAARELFYPNFDSKMATRTLRTLSTQSSQQQPKLAYEWTVHGKVLHASMGGVSTTDGVEEKEVIVFLHGLLGNSKVCNLCDKWEIIWIIDCNIVFQSIGISINELYVVNFLSNPLFLQLFLYKIL